MFTGLIQDMGSIRAIDRRGDWLITIETQMDLSHTKIGASIACAGVCLTLLKKGDGWFNVQASAETLSKTHIGTWDVRRKINLEPSLRLGDELGGHFVFGHVDGLAEIIKVEASKDSHILTLQAPQKFASFLAPKGSVALDGISLTINSVEDAIFTVNIIPHTWAHTTLGLQSAGAALHIEIDMLARYVARILGKEAA